MPHQVTPTLIEDRDEIAKILTTAIRVRRAESPEAVAYCIEELIGDIERNRDLAKHADFQRRQGDTRGAIRSLNEAREFLNVLRNQVAHVQSHIDRCTSQLSHAQRSATGFVRSPDGSRPGDLTHEQMKQGLTAISNEFHSWRFERRPDGYHFIARTFDISLAEREGGPSFNFGQFDIDLGIAGLMRGTGRSYKVIAVTPRPSHYDEGIPHPHVSGEQLCEGNGAQSITQLLEHGDFYMFFVLINQTLSNYNPGSPYVRLNEWLNMQRSERSNSSSCSVCGEEPEDAVRCAECGMSVCDDCASYCDERDRSICDDCKSTLRSRRQPCDGCDIAGSSDCLIYVNDACSDCDDSDGTRHVCSLTSGIQLCQGCLDERARAGSWCCTSNARRRSTRCLLRTRRAALALA
jgi:hypothetical protein